MKRRKNSVMYVVAALLMLGSAGCAPLVIGGAAVTAGAGTYVYVQGELKTDYPYQFEQVWNATERVFADMRGIDVIPEKEIGKGRIEGIIDSEKVRVTITYKARELTNVSVRVGLIGDRTASQRIHDKIGAILQ
ncbi:MAG: DUF3568 domain-containing protein [Syntrophales bacterium]|jgi:hypothetical protein|nr:DUF3568 domain-containing protein [Syntrophales bacterium]MCK9527764.1 DUF3568 domain-containing protein [Syntrophales bacterium]MDX9921581.1 DUF3568 family protein [Syntrophales bacterium]